MFLGIHVFIFVALVPALHVHCRVIHQYSSEAKLVIYPQQLYLNAIAGESLDLLCTGEGPDLGAFSDFKWLNPNHEEIPKGSPGVEEVGAYSMLLTFVSPTVEESGVYKCTATYKDSEYLETEVSILFQEDIKFEDCSESQVLYNNEKGEIRCHLASKGELSITWTKDNKKLEVGHFTFTTSGIEISNVSEEDAGTYLIEVFEPTTGTFKSRNITVDVLNRDGENVTGAVKSVSVVNVTVDSVVFDINVTGNVESIEAKYRESLDETDKIVTWKIRDVYALQNLIPGGRYSFQFRAKPYRSTKWSETRSVTLLPEAPEVILRQLNEEMIGIEWVRTEEDVKRDAIDKYQISYQPVHMVQNSWMKSQCNISMEIPTACAVSVYKLVNISPSTMYEIRVKAHTSAGYGEAYTQKVEIYASKK